MPLFARSSVGWRVVSVPVAVVALAAVGVRTLSPDVAGALIIGPFLFCVSLPVLLHLHRRESDPRITRLLVVALALKLLASLARYAVAFVVYEGTADAATYHRRGSDLAVTLARLEWVQPPGPFPGTGAIEVLTGVVYTVTGPNILGGYLVFSWLGFWGLYLCFRAFALAVPDGNRFRYACLVLLLPSLLFWPSGIGKESWMVLMISLSAYGAARLFVGRSGGLLCLAGGLLGTGIVRPHITLIVVLAVIAGYVVRPGRVGRGGGVGKVATLGLLLLAGAVVLSQAQTFLGVDAQEGRTVGVVLDETARQTAQGGSSFGGASVRNPATLPLGIVTVLFRPFPFEASNFQALMTSLEGLVLMVLFLVNRARLWQVPRMMLTQPYVAFCVTYTLLFCVAFSSFNNFGILTRQRIQVFPVVLVLLAVPLLKRPRHTVEQPGRGGAAPPVRSGRERRAALHGGSRDQPWRNHSTV